MAQPVFFRPFDCVSVNGFGRLDVDSVASVRVKSPWRKWQQNPVSAKLAERPVGKLTQLFCYFLIHPEFFRMMQIQFSCGVRFVGFWLLIPAALISADVNAADALERLALPQLRMVHETTQQFALDRRQVNLQSGYEDVRALLHIHSFLSHDSVGTPEEIREAAVEAGVRVVMFTNHPADTYDYIKDGHSGIQDGVMFIPGAEEKGLLAFPRHSVERPPESTPQDKVDTVLAADGQIYLSHLEERMDWDLNGLTGSEIYNIHADFKDEPALLAALVNPVTLMTVIAPAVRQYPQEVIAALQDHPVQYLQRWDELCQKQRLTGVSANDSHQNTGVKAVVADNGDLQVFDATGDQLARLEPSNLLLRSLLAGKKPGDVLFELQLDPYVNSFRHVSTHLLMNEFNEDAVRECLAAGRAYVAFDWICDPTGFVFQAKSVESDEVWPIGAEVKLSPGLTLHAEAPLSATFRLIRDGKEIHHTRSHELEYDVDTPGVYRVEVWLNFPDEPRTWILSNPIYVR